ELLVAMAISSVVVASGIGAVTFFIDNLSLVSTRNNLSANLQAGLQKTAGVIRSSDNVLLYNLEPDNNAPTVKAGESANVPGPPSVPADDDYRYYWRSTSSQLVVSQPSRDASDAPIYTDSAKGDFTGPRDSIVWYIKDNTLYQRTVYSSQSASSTQTCGGTSTTGGCSSDIKLVENIQLVGGVPQFFVTYLDGAGVPIPATLPNGSSNYDSRKLTRAVKIDMRLEVIVGERKVVSHDTLTVSFRKGQIPGATVIGDTSGGVGKPPAPPYEMTGMYIGPGGLTMASLTNFTGSQLNVKGRISMSTFAQIGAGGAPTTLNVGNQACGTPPNWPTVCGTQPIAGPGSLGTTIYGRVCATGQTTGTAMYNTGLQLSCTSPPIELPTYDRVTFMNSMKTEKSGNNGSCDVVNFSPKTLGPDVLYNSSLVNNYLLCTMAITGNIYIKGSFVSAQPLTMYVSESVGTKRPLVVVEGGIYLSAFNRIIPNSYGTGVDFISFASSNANCLTTPACSDRTDQSYLYNSQGVAAITIDASTVTGSTFYAYYGRVNLGAFTTTGGVSGQSVFLNAASVYGP
ncbi:hypothetical protein KDA23_02295, partial [Candidatus Saccharibacteria bacterium]|nr:hypothetical protein [Candidatus Saccharibacteria bacterium]